METCSPRSSPFSDGFKLKLSDEDFADQATKQEYQSGIGSLTYGMQGTRPDMAYSISLLSRFLSKPIKEHYCLFKGILRYLRGSIKRRIVYSRGSQQGLVAFTDSDYAGKTLAGDGKSTSGYVIFLAGGPICWSSKRQSCVTTSSTESEYVGQANTINISSPSANFYRTAVATHLAYRTLYRQPKCYLTVTKS